MDSHQLVAGMPLRRYKMTAIAVDAVICHHVHDQPAGDTTADTSAVSQIIKCRLPVDCRELGLHRVHGYRQMFVAWAGDGHLPGSRSPKRVSPAGSCHATACMSAPCMAQLVIYAQSDWPHDSWMYSRYHTVCGSIISDAAWPAK